MDFISFVTIIHFPLLRKVQQTITILALRVFSVLVLAFIRVIQARRERGNCRRNRFFLFDESLQMSLNRCKSY